MIVNVYRSGLCLLHNLTNPDICVWNRYTRKKETLGMTSSFRNCSDGVIVFSFCVRVDTHMPIDCQ
jgi:hypothetical protein